MSNSRTKRVSFSLHLSPGDSLADQRAFTTLQKWLDGLKQAGGEREDLAMEMRSFHRNIYLAGLQLQLLSPKLCGHIAESIGRETLTLPELVSELSSSSLLPPGAPARTAAGELFSDQQLEQLQQLMKTTMPDMDKLAAASQSAGQPDAAEQTAELARLRGEIGKMSHLLEQQNLQLQQLRRSERHTPAADVARGGSTEEMALSEVAASAEKMKKIRQKGIF